MAKTDIPIDIRVSGKKDIDGANLSLKELKKQLKEAQAAALNGDGAAARRVAELRDRLEDLNDSTRSLQGSGVERVGNSFGLLGEGLSNFDWDKIKIGFQGIGAAMKAIPIFLVAEGIRYLIENWEKLSEGNGFLAKTLRAVGEVLDWVGDKINAFTDLIGVTNTALDKQGEAIKTNAEKARDALADQTAEYDRQIKVAKAAGKSTIELEKAKQEAIVKTNYEIAKQIEAYVRAGGTLDEEKRKQLTASLAAIKEARTQEKVDEIADQKDRSEKYQDYLKKQIEAHDKAIDERAKAEEEDLARQKANEQIRVDFFKLSGEERKEAEIINTQSAADEKLAIETQNAQDIHGVRLNNSEKLRDLYKREAAEQIANSQAALTSIQGLSDTFFTLRMANAQKGSEEELKLAKRQFEINKALQLATAAINGAQSVLAILSVPDFTLGIQSGLRIAAAVATTAATIAKISTTQFQSPGGGGGVSVPNISGSLPNINTQAPNVNQPQQSTYLEGKDRPMNVNVTATVVETQSTATQNRVRKLKDQATF